MDQRSLEAVLSELPIGKLQYYQSIGSTNDQAALWYEDGAPDFSIVIADEQTAGRGRLGRSWHTPPGASLAFSILLYNPFRDSPQVERISSTISALHPRLTGLGALSVSITFQESYKLAPLIRWPNDVLLNNHKVCGVLVEAKWEGDRFSGAILGIGINIASPSVPPPDSLFTPATCLEQELGFPVEREKLLYHLITKLLYWQNLIGSPQFIRAWEKILAYRGEWVQIIDENQHLTQPSEGKLIGIDDSGYPVIRDHRGQEFTIKSGSASIRPIFILGFREEKGS